MLPLAWIRWLFLAAMLLALPALCAAPEAMLHCGSGTTVDSTTAVDGMRVFSGQRVHNPEGRFSDLLARSTTIRVLGNSNVQFAGDSAELLEGGVALNTTTQFPVLCGCATVTPVNAAKARYVVQLQHQTVYVTAEAGNILVQSKKKSRNLPTGKTAAVFCATAAQDILFAGPNLPANVVAGATAASAIAAPAIIDNISGSSPDR